MTPLERAARALFKRDPGPYGDCVDWAIEQDFGWCDRVDDARAVLQAIREPSEHAMDCGAYRLPGIDAAAKQAKARDVYRAMIDAALEEG